MKSQVGLGAAALLALAALVGVRSQPDTKTATNTESHAGSAAAGAASKESDDDLEGGACQDLEEKLKTFAGVSSRGVAAPLSCYGGGRKKIPGSGGEILSRTKGLQFVIAIVPDPLHTHFSLSFDRSMEAIQQAAQDQNYLYDSSWLPWDTGEQSWERLADSDEVDRRKKIKEDQPGVLLFRKIPPRSLGAAETKGEDTGPLAPYAAGLVVFVIAEEPTSGIHKQQFENAVEWIAELQQRPTGSAFPMKILGPTFSGSLPSLAQVLEERGARGKSSGAPKANVAIFSGSITSEALVHWFATTPISGYAQTFQSFQTSGDRAITRYRGYLHSLGVSVARLAILSEDETAFGTFRGNNQDPLCKEDLDHSAPACLYYPRDISALRSAYQKQSIFNAGSSEQIAASSARRSLSTDIADPSGREHDTIQDYGGNQGPLSQEAALEQLVSQLRAHDSEYVILRSSNPMDQLFLSHFLRLTYPQGRIVIQGADLLMRREGGAATLSGIMTLTTYPEFVWENHWTSLFLDKSHSHRVFAQDTAEGIYVAARFLFNANAENSPGEVADHFLPPNIAHLPIRDYAPPFWLTEGQAYTTGTLAPVTWLSVLGRDGFWPVAALSDMEIKPAASVSLSALLHSSAYAPEYHPWQSMPISMKICLFLVFLWSLFHLYCCARASITVKPSYRAHFVRVPGGSHAALVVLGSVIVSFVPIVLGWGYGALSLSGEPIAAEHAWMYRAFLPLIWFIGACAVCVNAWVAEKKAPTWPSNVFPLLFYCLGVGILLAVIAIVLEAGLNPANRVPTYWRSMTLTNGVSPMIPLVALAVGLYFWFWYSLRGLGLLGEDRPLLPKQEDLGALAGPLGPETFLSMFSREKVANPIEEVSQPFATGSIIAFFTLFVFLAFVALWIAGGVPVRSLGHRSYSIVFCIGLDICVSLMLSSAWQLLRIWVDLKQLLVFLNLLPLRRTMRALKGYSWGKVWSMGGNVLDERYKLLSRQMESLTHLKNVWPGRLPQQAYCQPGWHARIAFTETPRVNFIAWYGKSWREWRARDLADLKGFQKAVADAVGYLLGTTLVSEWSQEKASLILGKQSEEDSDTDKRKDSAHDGVPDSPPYLRSMEELVCLTYLGFIQNMLGRMRTLVMIIASLFVAVTVSLGSYPFDPRPEASLAMLLLLLVLGSVIAAVYAQMHRDSTLSYVTDTVPGELGAQFWLKMIGFATGPVLGLLATSFPELTGSLFSWLQPGLESIK